MGGSTTGSTTTGSTASSDPQVTSTLNQLLGGLSSAYTAGPTYVAPGATTTGLMGRTLSTTANNLAYSSGYSRTAPPAQTGEFDQFRWPQQHGTGCGSGSNNDLASQYGAMANDPEARRRRART